MANISKLDVHISELPDFSAVIFDLDGLIIDSEITYIAAWQQAGAEMGHTLSDNFCNSLSGLHQQAVMQALIDYCGADFNLLHFQQISGQYWHEYVQQHGIPLKAGVLELLSALQELVIPFALATNSLTSNALECLALAGLNDVFPVMVSRDQVQAGKPAPDIFLCAAARLRQPISTCLVLEDSYIGIQAAHAAGAIPVLIPSNTQAVGQAEHLTASVFTDLHQIETLIRTRLCQAARFKL